MARPRYETQKDLDNEQEIANYLTQAWQCQFIKLEPFKWRVDFLLIGQANTFAWLEIKTANMRFGQWPFTIAFKKIEAARALAKTSGYKFILMFRCKDALVYHVWDFEKEYKFEFGGRTRNTRDSQDIEPVFRIDPKDCQKVEGF